MKMKISASRSLIIVASLLGAAIGITGCADYASVGVGYGDAYYVPDYRPLYASYFYDGLPWWGPNYYYTRKKIVVKDVDRRVNVNRNVYYGGHHFVRDWRGRGVATRAAGGGRFRDRR
jgi:hypothetical protein